MQIKIANHKEFAAGALFLAIGIGWGILSLQLNLGRMTRMGPGYFPLCMSVALAFIGLIAMVRSIRGVEVVSIEHFPIAPFSFLLIGMIGFGLLVRTGGLIPATLFVLACCCHRLWRSRPLEAIAICVAFTAAASLIFVYGLGLPIKLYSFSF
ncbi:hypothetical protein FHT86_007724 [Rhizobium sp. BK313]|uniref:tripartite tricarboxylate transporter TctB family protein n=1 Tax=Rhizobium sp. BK313 TaxID=2587081 RepID=UPI0010D22227|nr:tripartite tricarboxylate transporter TctB family protein [Rhizobium sp. BK313]MBB3459392.1 hypothetical protein [Rhizobium sp. BK313]